MQFQDVIGQEALKSHLRRAISLGKVSHAYIIDGDEGYGKLRLAEAFAQTLLCTNVNPVADDDQFTLPGLETVRSEPKVITEPCNVCTSCNKANHHNHPDIIYISHEKPNLISADEIRGQIVGTVDILPYESERKVYIIDEGELINEVGQNILLKTIEEPPDYITIIILTTNKDKMLPTVLSRCVNLSMAPVDDRLIKSYLMSRGVVDYQADMAISFAGGNPGRALAIAGDSSFEMRRRLVCDVMRYVTSLDMGSAADLAAKIDEDSDNVYIYIDLIMIMLRDALVLKTTRDEGRIHFRQETTLVRSLSSFAVSKLDRLVSIVNDAKDKIRVGVSLGLVIEMMIGRMKECVNG